jgi:hypothetical protein
VTSCEAQLRAVTDFFDVWESGGTDSAAVARTPFHDMADAADQPLTMAA